LKFFHFTGLAKPLNMYALETDNAKIKAMTRVLMTITLAIPSDNPSNHSKFSMLLIV